LKDACFYSAAAFIVVIYFDITIRIVKDVNVSVVDADDNGNIGVD